MKGGSIMKKIRFFLVLLLTIALVSTLIACSGNGGDSNEPKESDSGERLEPGKTEPGAKDGKSVLAQYPMLENLDLDGTLSPEKYGGKKIVVASSGGDFEASLKIYASLFNELTGSEVEVQSFPDQLFEKVQLALNSGGQFDVIVVPIAFIHSFAYSGLVSDVTEMLDTVASPSYEPEDFLEGLYNTYAKYDGKTVAFPFKPDSQIFFYRKDLFEDETIKASFKDKFNRELTVPETPEEMLEVAEFFTKSYNPDSPVEYGFCTMLSKSNSRFSWFNRLGYYGGKEVGDNFEPGFINGSGVKALQFMMDLIKFAPSDILTFDWDTSNTFFAQGNAAMMEQWPGLYLTCNQDSSPTKGKIGYAVCPGGSPTLGGWAMAITADSPEQELAFKFCEMVTSKDGEYIKIPYTMDPCRRSNYERDIVAEISDPDLYKALMDNLSVASQLADTDIPYISAQVGDIEETAIQAALTGDMTVEDAIDEMAKQFREIVDSVRDQLDKPN
jgi:multiple sugar transport system substrate-binding protein